MPLPPDRRDGHRRPRGQWLGGLPTVSLLLVLLLVVLVFAATSRTFATDQTAGVVLRSAAWIALIAVGATFALAAGAVDFSVMSTAALAGIVAAGVSGTLSPIAGIPVALAMGGSVGLVNALWVVRFGVNPFLATLVMAGAIRGIDFALGKGTRGVSVTDGFLGDVLPADLAGIPLAFWIVLVAAAAAALTVDRSRFGRGLLAVGGNPAAARMAGISAARVTTAAYVVSGIAAAGGGILLASRVGAGVPAAATGQELTLYSAILIAGTPLFGGRANIVGSVVAVVLLTTLYTGLVLAGFPDRLQQIGSGLLLLISIALMARPAGPTPSLLRRTRASLPR